MSEAFDIFIVNVLHPPRDLMAESSSILVKLEEFQQAGEIPEGFWNIGYSTPHYVATQLTILIGNNASIPLIRFAMDHGGDPSYRLELSSVPQLQGRADGTIPPPGFAVQTPEVLAVVMEYGFDPANLISISHPRIDDGNMYDLLMFMVKQYIKNGKRSDQGFDPNQVRTMIYHLYDMGVRPENDWAVHVERQPEAHWDDELEAYVDDDGDVVEDYDEDDRQYDWVGPAAQFKIPMRIEIRNDTKWYMIFPH